MEIVGSLGGGTGKRAVTFSTRRLQPLKGSAGFTIRLGGIVEFFKLIFYHVLHLSFHEFLGF